MNIKTINQIISIFLLMQVVFFAYKNEYDRATFNLVLFAILNSKNDSISNS